MGTRAEILEAAARHDRMIEENEARHKMIGKLIRVMAKGIPFSPREIREFTKTFMHPLSPPPPTEITAAMLRQGADATEKLAVLPQR